MSSATGATPGSTKRLRLLAIVVCIALASAVGGWLLGRRVKSPAEAAAERKPPQASLITVPIEEKVLSSDVVIRGTIRYAEPKKVGLAGPLGGAAAVSPIVTKAPARGADLNDGDVVVEASGRPVFALVGADPMYRAITPGASGADVKQLETALVRLGFDPGPVDGVFDDAAEAAVDKWYESKGFTSQGPSEEQRTQLRTLRNGALSAADSLRAAQKSLAEGSAGLSEAEKLELDIASRNAESTVDAAKSEQKRNDTEANAEVAAKQAARDAAAVARDAAKAPGAVNPSTSVAYTAAEIAALEAAVTAAQGQLDSARAGAEAIAKAGVQAVRAANDQLTLAQLRRAEAEKPKDTSQLQQ
ncbi:MAG: peptidoglycan-binding protein, partial [Acidimicrobiia bacterium]